MEVQSKKVIVVNKPQGQTPFECITRYRANHPEIGDHKLGYAGRLDPLAEGVLLILVGDETKKREHYELLPKTYAFEIIAGVETDTYDPMGIIGSLKEVRKEVVCDSIQHELARYIGKTNQPYPPFSSVRMRGKSLFYYAREGKLAEITIPEKEITIFDAAISHCTEVTLSDFFNEIEPIIARVSGDFRQQEILALWKKKRDENPHLVLTRAFASLSCSSGTYVRGIAHEIGKRIGCGGIAWNIKRTRVGEYLFRRDK